MAERQRTETTHIVNSKGEDIGSATEVQSDVVGTNSATLVTQQQVDQKALTKKDAIKEIAKRLEEASRLTLVLDNSEPLSRFMSSLSQARLQLGDL